MTTETDIDDSCMARFNYYLTAPMLFEFKVEESPPLKYEIILSMLLLLCITKVQFPRNPFLASKREHDSVLRGTSPNIF